MNKRITFKNHDGSWGLKNFDIKKVPSELYGAMCKLKDYEESGAEPAEVQEMKEWRTPKHPECEYKDECICPGCGKTIEDYDVTNIKFCPECGQAWKWEE